MKIVEISSEIIKIQLRTPFITALRRVDDVEFVRVSVTTDDDYVYLGEAPATKAITGEDLLSITEAIETNKELFYGLSPSDAIDKVHTLSIGSSAKACMDMAFYVMTDFGMQSHAKQGNESNDNTPKTKTAITISYNEKTKMLIDAKDAVNNGHRILKLKFGDDISHAIDVTHSVQRQIPNTILLVDANQAWSLSESKKYIDSMANTNIELLEQPVIAKDIEGLRELKNYSDIPIVADEACFTLSDVKKVVESKSADIINIKFMKCGGITKAKEILEYCRTKQVPVMMGSMLEGPISIGYACYLVDEYSDVIKYVDLDSPLLYK